jgi:hypothetical protein
MANRSRSELSHEIKCHVLGEVWTAAEVHRNLLDLCDDIGCFPPALSPAVICPRSRPSARPATLG